MEWEQKDNQKAVEDLRRRFLTSKGDSLHELDARDVTRVRNDDHFLWLFLRHQMHEIDKALIMLIDCLQWRESFGMNDLSERMIDRRLFEIGFFYPRNKDRNGNPLVLFHAHLYKKELHDPAEVKNLIAFGLEKLWQKNPGGKVSVLFDMQDASLANMDMILLKFVIVCFQTYYPMMLEYLIVYETPWILTAAWKIVKTWLSTMGISKIKFVNKSEILQFVSADQLLTSMGGLDTFTYSYPPQLFTGRQDPPAPCLDEKSEQKPSTETPVQTVLNGGLTVGGSGDLDFSSLSVDPSSIPPKHSTAVGLQQGGGSLDEFTHVPLQNGDVISSIEYSLTDSNVHPKQVKTPETTLTNKMASKRESRKKRDQLEHVGPLATICPCSELVFCAPSRDDGEILQILTISNTVSSTVAFKVKTTTPENYRVRPSSGPIPPGSTIEVNVYLQPGSSTTMTRDKFLVLTTVLPEQDRGDLQSIWKRIPKSSIMEHRMRCRFEMTSQIASIPDSELSSSQRVSDRDHLELLAGQLTLISDKVENIEHRFRALERNFKYLLNALIFITILLLLPLILYAIYFTKDIVLPFI